MSIRMTCNIVFFPHNELRLREYCPRPWGNCWVWLSLTSLGLPKPRTPFWNSKSSPKPAHGPGVHCSPWGHQSLLQWPQQGWSAALPSLAMGPAKMSPPMAWCLSPVLACPSSQGGAQCPGLGLSSSLTWSCLGQLDRPWLTLGVPHSLGPREPPAITAPWNAEPEWQSWALRISRTLSSLIFWISNGERVQNKPNKIAVKLF